MLTGREIRCFFLLAITIVGCATSEEIIEPKPPSFDQPLVERLPLRIAYGFDPSVDREVFAMAGDNERYHLWLGPATRTTFERVFAALFAETVNLDEETAAQEASRGWDGTIQLHLTAARMQSADDAAWVTFELIFLNPDRDQEGVWRVPGNSRAADSGQRNMELAIQAAAAEVARDLGRQPPIRGWLDRRGSSHVDPSRK